MIAVKVADKDMAYSMCVDAGLRNLQLRTFTTINQKMSVLNIEILRRCKPAVSRNGPAGSEYG